MVTASEVASAASEAIPILPLAELPLCRGLPCMQILEMFPDALVDSGHEAEQTYGKMQARGGKIFHVSPPLAWYLVG